jgi:hypothetical protein
MKRLLVMLMCASSISAVGQDIRIGIKGGVNFSDVVLTNYFDPDGEASFKMKIGEHAGVFSSVDLSKQFGLAVELLYSNKGVNAPSKINFRYINLPVLLQYKLTEKLLAEVGPEVGYMFSARSKYGNVAHIWDNKIDIGLALGIQYAVLEKLNVGARYYAGFSSVQEPAQQRDLNNNAEETIKYQNRVMQFYVSFEIGKIAF